jgi:uncharacterized membrane protein YhaH (DUF805 family)
LILNPGTLFFSFRGRLNRAKYWLAIVIFAVAWKIGEFLEFQLGYEIINFLIFLTVMISGISVGIRRLHDRNKSAWWLLLFYFVPSALFLTAIILSDRDGGTLLATVRQGVIIGSGVAVALGLSAIAIWVWTLIELGCRRGTPGPNRFGNDPVEKNTQP